MYIDIARLKAARIAAGLSLRDLAELSKVSKSAISFYELGRKTPKFEAVKAIATALNVSLEYLTGASDNKETPVPELTEGERAWLELYRKISPELRETYQWVVEKFDELPDGERQMLLAMISAAVKTK